MEESEEAALQHRNHNSVEFTMSSATAPFQQSLLLSSERAPKPKRRRIKVPPEVVPLFLSLASRQKVR